MINNTHKIESFDDLRQVVDRRPKRRVALAAAEDKVLLMAAAQAQREGMADFTLVGEPGGIFNLLSQLSLDISFDIIESFEPAKTSVDLVRAGEADLLMKGHLPTKDLLKAVLDPGKGLRAGERLNHIAVIESPRYHKLLFITDGGINLQYDRETFVQIVHNSTSYVTRFGVNEPLVGMMTLTEEVNEKISETILARDVVAELSTEISIEGPIAPDVALSKEAAIQKGIDSAIAGEVDIMVMPNTTAANHLVKGLNLLGNCLVGGVIVGATVPIILLSRSDSTQTKYRSILLGLI